MGPAGTEAAVARILNDAWMVRHHARGGRIQALSAGRDRAIEKLGLTVREAFASCDDFEPLLAAICDGLRPHDEQPF